MATLESIEQGINELKELVRGSGGAPGGVGLVHPGPNGLAVIGGWVFAIDEPIAADWKPGMESIEYLARYGKIGNDPSNAFDSGLPKRSPSGYPLFYPVGQYGPYPPGRILYGGSSLKDEAELAEHKARAIQYPGTGGTFSPGGPR